MRKDSDKVPNLDVFFLWSILTPRGFCNIPHCLATYLASRAAKDKTGVPICGGMFFTKLAKSYGLFERGAADILTLMLTRAFNVLLYKRARIMEDNEGNNFSIPNDDEVVQP